MSNASDLLDFTGIRYYDAFAQAWASGAFATKAELSAAMEQAGRAYHYCGSVPSVDDLPASASVGDVYNIDAAPVWTVLPEDKDPMEPPYRYCGEVESFDDLPETNCDPNDVYLVGGSVNRYYYYVVNPLDGENYAWMEDATSGVSGWDRLGDLVDLTGYVRSDNIPTPSTPGLLSPSDKAKLDSIDWHATSNAVDSALSTDTPSGWDSRLVCNSAVTHALEGKLGISQVVSGGTWVSSGGSSGWSGAANGAMIASDKRKLDGIAEGANNYELPAANSSALGGVIVDPDVYTTYPADGSASGAAQIPSSEVAYHVVQNAAVYDALQLKLDRDKLAVASLTSSAWSSGGSSGWSEYWSGVSNGAMAAADKAKLNGIASNANYYVLPQATSDVLGGVKVDTEVKASSVNPVQNSAVYRELSSKIKRTDYAVASSTVTSGVTSWAGVSAGTIKASDYAKLKSIAYGAGPLSAATTSTLGGVIVDSKIWTTYDDGAVPPETPSGDKQIPLSSKGFHVVQNSAVYSRVSQISAAIADLVPLEGGATSSVPVVIGGSKRFTSVLDASITGSASAAGALVSSRTITVQVAGVSGSGTFDGTADCTISVPISSYVGATSAASGTAGLVPAAAPSDTGRYLLGNGQWGTVDGAFVHLSGNGSSLAAVETVSGGAKIFSGAVQFPDPSGSAPVDYGLAYAVSGSGVIVSFGDTPPGGMPDGAVMFSGVSAITSSGGSVSGAVYANSYSMYVHASGSWIGVSGTSSTGPELLTNYLLIPCSGGAYVPEASSMPGRWNVTYNSGAASGKLRLCPCGDPSGTVCVLLSGTSSTDSSGHYYAPPAASAWLCNGFGYSALSGSLGYQPAFHVRVAALSSGGILEYSGDYWWSGTSWTNIGSSYAMQAANVAYVTSQAITAADAGCEQRGFSIEASGARHAFRTLPRYLLGDIGPSSLVNSSGEVVSTSLGLDPAFSGLGLHPAFSGALKVDIGAYQAGSGVNGLLQTVQGGVPAKFAGVGEAESAASAFNAAYPSGGGIAPVTAAAWGARALWLRAQMGPSASYCGNDSYGKCSARPWQTGVLAAEGVPGASSSDGRTLAGTPGWSDDGHADGLYDMTGNLREYVAGVKLVDGMLMISDGGRWKYLDATHGLTISQHDSSVRLSWNSGASAFTWTGGAGEDAPAGAVQEFDEVSCGVGGQAEIMLKALALAPVSAGGCQGAFEVASGGMARKTLYAFRGGGFADAGKAGPFAIAWMTEDAAGGCGQAGVRVMYVPDAG